MPYVENNIRIENARIPDEEIESIPGIKKVGHKLVTSMQKDAAKLV